jgi:Flp pilus assembly protein TadB
MVIKSFNFLGLFLAGLAAVIVGYIALAGGSMTLAPTLLVAGYCLLIPWALFRLGHSRKDSGSGTAPGE